MTNKLISFELDGYIDDFGNYIDSVEEGKRLAQVALTHMINNNTQVGLVMDNKPLGERFKDEEVNMKVYKKSVSSKTLLLVGEVNNEDELVFYEPDKCIHQADYESPSLYELPFYSKDGEVVDESPDKRELLVENNLYSFGYYDKGKIVFWEQYE